MKVMKYTQYNLEKISDETGAHLMVVTAFEAEARVLEMEIYSVIDMVGATDGVPMPEAAFLSKKVLTDLFEWEGELSDTEYVEVTPKALNPKNRGRRFYRGYSDTPLERNNHARTQD